MAIEHYRSILKTGVVPRPYKCPLCVSARKAKGKAKTESICPWCPWRVFKGEICNRKDYGYILPQDNRTATSIPTRIMRLKGWRHQLKEIINR